MRIVIGSDHGGFLAKQRLVLTLQKMGHDVMDVGTDSEERADYPDYAFAVARAVAAKKADRGVLICGTGIGMCIAANKVRGIRAALVWNPATAVLASEHNNANVLCLGARQLRPALIPQLVALWLRTPFGGERHLRRVKKITRIEKEASC